MQPTPGENVPQDVTDIMLWRLATSVAESHQPDPNDPRRCANLRCAYETYPCLAARSAEQALRASRARLEPGASAAASPVESAGRADAGHDAEPAAAWPSAYERPHRAA